MTVKLNYIQIANYSGGTYTWLSVVSKRNPANGGPAIAAIPRNMSISPNAEAKLSMPNRSTSIIEDKAKKASTKNPKHKAAMIRVAYDSIKGSMVTKSPVSKMAMLVRNRESTQEKWQNQHGKILPRKLVTPITETSISALSLVMSSLTLTAMSGK